MFMSHSSHAACERRLSARSYLAPTWPCSDHRSEHPIYARATFRLLCAREKTRLWRRQFRARPPPARPPPGPTEWRDFPFIGNRVTANERRGRRRRRSRRYWRESRVPMWRRLVFPISLGRRRRGERTPQLAWVHVLPPNTPAATSRWRLLFRCV